MNLSPSLWLVVVCWCFSGGSLLHAATGEKESGRKTASSSKSQSREKVSSGSGKKNSAGKSKRPSSGASTSGESESSQKEGIIAEGDKPQATAASSAKTEEPKSTPTQSSAKSQGSPASGKTKRVDADPAANAGAEKAMDPAAKPAAEPAPTKQYAPSATIATSDLKEFGEQPPAVQKLIEDALELAGRNLTYTFGSDDPARGGMDCSGAVAYLLRKHGFEKVPRDASAQYLWARGAGDFFAVVSKKAGGLEFDDLKPGDLLFWSGTYNAQKDPPVTHSMIYLGTHKRRKVPVMWGSSDGRSYDGQARNGVSVFDFKMPRTAESGDRPQADFLGYARIPGLREEVKEERREPAASTGGAEKLAADAGGEDAATEPEAVPEKAKPSTGGKKRSGAVSPTKKRGEGTRKRTAE